MDDKRIEDMLHEYWNPHPPEGMRNRILRRSREELTRHESVRPLQRIGPWRLVLAGLALFAIILTNLSDHSRQARLSALIYRPNSAKLTESVCKINLRERRLLLDRYLAIAHSEQYYERTIWEDDLL